MAAMINQTRSDFQVNWRPPLDSSSQDTKGLVRRLRTTVPSASPQRCPEEETPGTSLMSPQVWERPKSTTGGEYRPQERHDGRERPSDFNRLRGAGFG
jgi:hypothetical protein